MHTNDPRLIIPHGLISVILSWVNSDSAIQYHLLPALFGSYPMLCCFAFASRFFLILSNTRAEKPAANPPPIRPIRPPYTAQNSLKISEGVKGSKTVTVKFAIACNEAFCRNRCVILICTNKLRRYSRSS